MINLHRENTIYNTVLSKAYQKGQRGRVRVELYYGGEVFVLEPDEVIAKLKGLGVDISRKTLYNWEKWGLIPEPVFRNSRTTEYPDHAWAEAYASYRLKDGPSRLRVRDIKEVRERALEIEGTQEELQLLFDNFGGWGRMDYFINGWLTERARVLCGFMPGDKLLTDTTDFWVVGPGGKRRRKVKLA